MISLAKVGGRETNKVQSDSMPSMRAQVILPVVDLTEEMSFFSGLGFRLMQIFPDDSPEVAVMEGHGITICLDKRVATSPATLNLLTDDAALLQRKEHVSPAGTRLLLQPESYRVVYPPVPNHFEVRRLLDSDPWVIGRAGMQYRDLLPSRLDGSIMASHIRIPKGGPVPDLVHYHTIGFQLIFCYHGWVKLVYEDQGPPFILEAGDCVTQPPEIRHRVLEASDQLEVIEIGVPAQHMTSIDHDMVLPTDTFRPDRKFHGQTFCHHRVAEAQWKTWKMPHFKYRETGVLKATGDLVSVQVAQYSGNGQPAAYHRHSNEIQFTFIMNGRLELHAESQSPHTVKTGEAFVVPRDVPYKFEKCSADLELLEVALTRSPGV